MAKSRILLVSTPGLSHRELQATLTERGLLVVEAGSETEVVRAFEVPYPPSLVLLTQPAPPGIDLFDLAARLRRRDRRLPIVLLAREGGERAAIRALRAGVKDYFPHPYGVSEVVERILSCLTDSRSTGCTGGKSEAARAGAGPVWHTLGDYLDKLAVVDSNVLITGETGTGKEVAAEYIHRGGRRRDRPLVCINCAALPDALLESELFGYAKGAFTGAQHDHPGKLRLADGGTVLLDEIGDMSPYAQAKVLRLIEDRQVWPLGGRRALPVDVRIIAATNRVLEAMVAGGEFRRDLYYRLNVGRVRIPPLRDRKEEIPRLFEHFLREQCTARSQPLPEVEADVLECLLRYDWPGNIRELKNLAEVLFIDPPEKRILVGDLPPPIGNIPGATPPLLGERERLLAALEGNDWNKTKAAATLGWSRMTLYRKLKLYAIRRDP
jgi:DNA-binding NtrC family response regulator